MNSLGPYYLDTRATYWMLHFDVWGDNFLRERLAPFGYKAPYREIPPAIGIICKITGQTTWLPSHPSMAEETIAMMEKLRVESIEKHGRPK